MELSIASSPVGLVWEMLGGSRSDLDLAILREVLCQQICPWADWINHIPMTQIQYRFISKKLQVSDTRHQDTYYILLYHYDHTELLWYRIWRVQT